MAVILGRATLLDQVDTPEAVSDAPHRWATLEATYDTEGWGILG
jgi:hypothetical protein